MLRVLIDKFGIVRDDSPVINSQKDYAQLWQEIARTIQSKHTSVIVVRNAAVEQSLANLEEKFSNRIEIERVAPRLLWEQTFGYALPSDVDDMKIAELLLSRDINIPEDDVRRCRLHTLCILSGVTRASAFVPENALMECILIGVEQDYPLLLGEVVRDIAEVSQPGAREFWQRLIEEKNKKEFLLDVIRCLIVRNYPDQASIRRKHYRESLLYPGLHFPGHLCGFVDQGFRRHIAKFLQMNMNTRALSYISGKLSEEWEAVLRVLEKHPVQDRATISPLLRKAVEYPKFHEEVNKYMPVRPPPTDLVEANVEDWLKSYFEFYLYTRRIGRPEDTEPYVETFEQFFLERYLASSDFFSKHSVLRIRREILEQLATGRKVLLLVLDGLSYAYYTEIEKIVGERGSFLFSTPPTETMLNKQRILCGLLDFQEDYNYLLARFYGNYRWGEADSDKKSLEDFLSENHDLYIYWENHFDNYIHRRMRFDKRFRDHLEILNEVSRQVQEFLEDGGVIFLLGDHGYTTLPCQKSNRVPITDRRITIRNSRVIELKKNSGESLPIEHVHWLDNNLGVARSYHYFGTAPIGGTHGGATPEEAIVPLFVLEKKAEELRELLFRLTEDKYLRRKKHSVALVVHNPNAGLVGVDMLQFVPPILKVLSPLPHQLMPGENQLEAELDLTTVRTERCTFFVSYMAGNAENQASFEIHTTGAIAEDLDDWD